MEDDEIEPRAAKNKKKTPAMVFVPLNGKVLFMKDEDKAVTKGGIILPDDAKIQVLTGRVVSLAEDIRRNRAFKYLRKFDKIMTNYRDAVPFELEAGNRHYLVPVTSITGV